MKSVETQTEERPPADIYAPQINNDQLSTLLKTITTAMLWIAKDMKPSAQQSQVLTQLTTVLQIIGVRRRNSEPLTTAREIANISTQNSKSVDTNIAEKPVDNTDTYAECHFGQPQN